MAAVTESDAATGALVLAVLFQKSSRCLRCRWTGDWVMAGFCGPGQANSHHRRVSLATNAKLPRFTACEARSGAGVGSVLAVVLAIVFNGRWLEAAPVVPSNCPARSRTIAAARFPLRRLSAPPTLK